MYVALKTPQISHFLFLSEGIDRLHLYNGSWSYHSSPSFVSIEAFYLDLLYDSNLVHKQVDFSLYHSIANQLTLTTQVTGFEMNVWINKEKHSCMFRKLNVTKTQCYN